MTDLRRMAPATFVERDRRRRILGLARHAERIFPGAVVRLTPLHEAWIVVTRPTTLASPRHSQLRDGYDAAVQPPVTADTWVDLTEADLPIGAVYEWCVRPDCGAIVLFSGIVRDHAVDDTGQMRDGVEQLTYEAYEAQTVPRFTAIAEETRRRWPAVRRIALLHRVGRLSLGESSVIAAVSSPHRPEAFAAARFAIDALKSTAPIWKHELWRDSDGVEGSAWGTGAHDLIDPAQVPGGQPAPASRGASS